MKVAIIIIFKLLFYLKTLLKNYLAKLIILELLIFYRNTSIKTITIEILARY